MSERPTRLERLRAALARLDLDALLVADLTNLRYLTGYIGSNALGILTDSEALLLTDARYAVSAREQVRGADVRLGRRDLLDDAAGALAECGARRIGIEADRTTLSRFGRLQGVLAGRELVETRGVVEDLRVVKDAEEIALIRRSAAITDTALEAVVADGLVGRRERDVAWAIETELRARGAEASSFEPIVAAADRGARPHAVPGDDPIPDNTLCVIDLGAVWRGYCSDMTRTFVLGDPGPELTEAYRLCHRAQRAALDAVAPGVAAAELDEVARAVIRDGGRGDAFGHGLGHGVGLDIHERPGVRAEGGETLAAGMVITVEPGIYLDGLGGVRIEDLVIVDEQGSEVVSKFPVTAPPGDE